MFKPRAQRSLKRLDSFFTVEKLEQCQANDIQSIIREEILIGVYQNSDKFTENILFCNEAFYSYSNEWERTAYRDIQSLASPLESKGSSKLTASEIVLKKHDGKIVRIRICGMTDGFRDFYTVYQFLRRIVNDFINKS